MNGSLSRVVLFGHSQADHSCSDDAHQAHSGFGRRALKPDKS